MEPQILITVTLIFFGACTLALALVSTVRLLRTLEASRYRPLWQALCGLQLCFVLGYLLTCILIITRHTGALLPLVGGVFCAGALFVLVVARLCARTIGELQEARAAAEAATTARSTFLANLSHELRTPLNAVIGYSALLLEEAAASGAPAPNEDLSRINRAGTHLLGLIDDILDHARLETGRIDLRPEPIALGPLIGAVVASVEPVAAARGNTLNVQIDPALPSVVADELRLRQILVNLLANACTFTEHGRISLEVKGGAGTVLFIVRDTGIGMSRDQLSRIFQPFVQATSHTIPRNGGTGLGLTIARQLAHLMGGEIGVASRPGRGSVFTVSLPLQPAHQPAPSQRAPRYGAEPNEGLGRSL